MAIDIILADITNGDLNVTHDWEGTGVFDVLIGAVNKNIESQYAKGRITGSDYATVYLGSIQAVLQQSMEYVLREKVTEAQVAGLEKDLELKTYELANIKPKELALMDKELLVKQQELELRKTESNRMKDTTEAELEKQWGYNVTRSVDGELVLGSTTGAGAIDKELELKAKQITAIEKDIVLKDAQKALVYTETIGKDKEVAMMGMDNVMKLREASKAGNTNYVYAPAYKETV